MKNELVDNTKNALKKPKKKRKWLRRIFKIFVWCFVAGLLLAIGVFAYYAKDLPSPGKLNKRQVVESTKIYDRTGNVLLYDVHGTMRRTAVALDAISHNIRNAAVAIEDTEFYQHFGFRPLSFARAVLADIFSGSFAQGGSTITQQVVKNALLTREKTIIRKLKEIVLAIKLEQIYSKDQILEIYLNNISYGGTLYGIEAASEAYFGVPAKDLSAAESAYLAAMIQAPTYYSPYGGHKTELEER